MGVHEECQRYMMTVEVMLFCGCSNELNMMWECSSLKESDDLSLRHKLARRNSRTLSLSLTHTLTHVRAQNTHNHKQTHT